MNEKVKKIIEEVENNEDESGNCPLCGCFLENYYCDDCNKSFKRINKAKRLKIEVEWSNGDNEIIEFLRPEKIKEIEMKDIGIIGSILRRE